jgi:hypothetical protein
LAGSGAEEERFAGGFDDFGGEGVELVDVADALDLGEEALDEAEVAVGDAGDSGDRFGVGEVVGVGGEAEFVPAVLEDEGEFVGAEGPAWVGEADAAVELGVAGEAFFDAGHADEDDSHGVAVVVVVDL